MSSDDRLPFEVEVERLPPWTLAASALVIVVGVLVAIRAVPMLALLPVLIASSLGRRFASSPAHVEITAEGLDVGGRNIPRSSIVDVWVDAGETLVRGSRGSAEGGTRDETEPRAIVAHGEDRSLTVFHFENRAQARRFGEAMGEHGVIVVGHRPRPIDMLASLRFVAIAIAFFATGSPYGLLVLVFFALGVWTVVQAKQVIVMERAFEIRTVFGGRTYAYEEIADVDVDAGTISLKDGPEVRLPRSVLRDPTLATAGWLERARTRALSAIQARRRG